MHNLLHAGIIDSTLREGAQAPGIEFSDVEKIQIIQHLSDLGVDEIELGIAAPCFTGLPSLIMDARTIANKKSRLSLWSRCRKEDIEFASKCAPDVLSLSIPVSDIHIHDKLGRDRQWVLDTLIKSIDDARQKGVPYISVGLEDASRGDKDFVARVASEAESAGASRLRLADTVGIATPGMTTILVQHARKHCSLPIGIHAHNDFGMATANTMAALEAGAVWADATVLGLGERAGNCRLEELVGYLCLIHSHDRYRPEKLAGLCKLISRAAGQPVARNHPVVGEEIFTCETGLHVHGLTVNPATYEPYDPQKIGRSRTIRFGGKTGKGAVRNVLASMNCKLTEHEAGKLVSRVRHMTGMRKIALNSQELANLARQEGFVSLSLGEHY